MEIEEKKDEMMYQKNGKNELTNVQKFILAILLLGAFYTVFLVGTVMSLMKHGG